MGSPDSDPSAKNYGWLFEPGWAHLLGDNASEQRVSFLLFPQVQFNCPQ
jgi:hypothetical protein